MGAARDRHRAGRIEDVAVAEAPAPKHGRIEHVSLGRGRYHGGWGVEHGRDDDAAGLARARRPDDEHGGLARGPAEAVGVITGVEAPPGTAWDVGVSHVLGRRPRSGSVL